MWQRSSGRGWNLLKPRPGLRPPHVGCDFSLHHFTPRLPLHRITDYIKYLKYIIHIKNILLIKYTIKMNSPSLSFAGVFYESDLQRYQKDNTKDRLGTLGCKKMQLIVLMAQKNKNKIKLVNCRLR